MEKQNKIKMKDNTLVFEIKKTKFKKNIPIHIKLDNKDYVIIPENEYLKMKETIKNSNRELIFSMLEKEIMQEMPKDFDDVYVVAKELLSHKNTKKITLYDIKRTLKEIKSNYPNLFVDIDEYFKEISNGNFE